MYSTYEVQSLADDGSANTLGWAIAQANANTDAQNTITFDPTLTASAPGTITLSSTALELDDTHGTLTINGPTNHPLTISPGTTGVFTIDSGTTASINNLVLGGLVADNGTLIASSNSPATSGSLALNISEGATFTPGPSVTLSSLWIAGTYNADITSDDLGTGYQQVTVTGGVSLTTTSMLDLSNATYGPSLQIQDQLTLVTTSTGFTGTFSNVSDGATVPLGLEESSAYCLASYHAGSSQNDLSLFCSQAPCSIVQQDNSVIAGEPANFELLATGSNANNSSWSISFHDSTPLLDISTQPSSVEGGVYQWDIQHIFPSDSAGSVSITANCDIPGHPGNQCALPITVNSAPMTNPISVGAAAESSTQIYVAWDPGSTSYDSFEVAAANNASGGSTFSNYTVVAAASGAAGNVLVTGLSPDTTYHFLVYGITASGSTCSSSVASAKTSDTPTVAVIPAGGDFPYGSYCVSDDLPGTVDYTWEGFDTSTPANAISLAPESGTGGTIALAPDTSLSAVTVVASLAGDTSGAFDSITYYFDAPTIIVTGTSGNDNFSVSNSSTGLYTITGSVTTIAPFYAPSGIYLEVQGRGGSDTLNVNGDAKVTLLNGLTSDGTSLTTDVATGSTLTNATAVAPLPTSPPSGLELPVPTPPTDLAFPSDGDYFSPPIGDVSTTGNILQATATANPGDVIALTTNDFSSTTQFWVYGQTNSSNGCWVNATIVSNASAGTIGGAAAEAVFDPVTLIPPSPF